MKIYPYQDGNRLIELVEKREYDDLLDRLESEKSTRNHMIKRGVEIERELNEARQKLAALQELLNDLEDPQLPPKMDHKDIARLGGLKSQENKRNAKAQSILQ